MARHWGEMKRYDIEMSGHNLYNVVHKLRLIFSKPDIEIPGRSEKKNGQTVDFSNTILCYNETKNKAQPIGSEVSE